MNFFFIKVLVGWMLIGYIGVYLYMRFLKKHMNFDLLNYSVFMKYATILMSFIGLYFWYQFFSLSWIRLTKPSLFKEIVDSLHEEYK